jgi:hypothetical protein
MIFLKKFLLQSTRSFHIIHFIFIIFFFLSGCSSGKENQKRKMILSFYLDDTSPAIASPEALKTFLDYCKANGVKGESTVVLGYDGESMAYNPDSLESQFLKYASGSYECGIDTHMEIMTHHELFDFEGGKMNENGIHEGLWLHEPEVSKEVYQLYFGYILDHGDQAGIQFTGFTWPGCGCDACSNRYGELREEGPLKFNPGVFDALLGLVSANKFRTKVIPIFYESSETDYDIHLRASDGDYAVYDLMPNAEDKFGIWENSTDWVDPDYYISEDGKSGIIVKHLKEGAPYCIWYMHWQGLNPGNGVGWEAFELVVERIETHLGDQVIWMRPSDVVTKYHKNGSWEFIPLMD